MAKPKKPLTCFIGGADIQELVQSEQGKSTMMPLLIKGCEEVVEHNLSEHMVLRIESFVRYIHKAYDFYVKREEITDTLDKIMEWGLEEEQYEICGRVKKILDSIKKEEF